jgi:hypothetical protein
MPAENGSVHNIGEQTIGSYYVGEKTVGQIYQGNKKIYENPKTT